jgi:ribonuclease P protein component
MIGRILRSADFERVLAAPQRSRSDHFAVHYVAGAPSRPQAAVLKAAAKVVVPEFSPELSTDALPTGDTLVDESGHWLGLVVPKRHAKRAVTRNLIKRQVRAAMLRHAASLPAGLWVVRLRAPFDKQQFLSPASDLLRDTTHQEVDVLFDRAARSPLPPQPARPRATRPRQAGGTAAAA